MDWQAFFSLLLASGAEWAEGFAIILSASLTIGWGASVGAAVVALVTLAAVMMTADWAVSLGLHGWILQLLTGFFLLRLGARRLIRAIAHQVGLKVPPNLQEIRPDLFGAERLDKWLTVFNAILLEGLEVCLMVAGFSLQAGAWLSNTLGALAGLVVVSLAGARGHASLKRAPEFAMKFVLGAVIFSFGTFWTLEALAGEVWPLGNWSPLVLAVFYFFGAQGLARLTGRNQPSGAET
jgi:uncharacterized membrane protein